MSSVRLLRCLNEPHEQRMGLHRSGQKLRVELAADHEGMVLQLCNLHQLSVWGHPREGHPGFFEILFEGIIEFKAVAMPLVYSINAIGFRGP
jgi:hypothetical protein